jgi:hypothetical protein
MYFASGNVQAQTQQTLVKNLWDSNKLEIQTDTVVYSKTEWSTTIRVTKKSDTCYVYTKTTMIKGWAGGWDKQEATYKQNPLTENGEINEWAKISVPFSSSYARPVNGSKVGAMGFGIYDF